MSASLRFAVAIVALFSLVASARAAAPAEFTGVSALTELLSSPRWDVRLWASETMGKAVRNAQDTLADLRKGTPSTNAEEAKRRETEIATMERALDLVRKKAVPALRAMSRNLCEEPMVRAFALNALGDMGPTAYEAIPDLPNLIVDQNWVVRRAAAGALEQLGRDPSPELFATIPAIALVLHSPDYGVRRLGTEALGSVGYDAQIAVARLAARNKVLEKQLQEQPGNAAAKNESQANAAQVARLTEMLGVLRPALVERLGDAEPWVRLSAVRAVANSLEPREQVPQLCRAIADGYPAVQRAVAESLGSLGVHVQDEALAGILKAQAVPALRQLLRSASAETREAAVRGLGQLGVLAQDAAKDIEERLSQDDDINVKHAAVEALLSLRGAQFAP